MNYYLMSSAFCKIMVRSQAITNVSNIDSGGAAKALLGYFSLDPSGGSTGHSSRAVKEFK